MDIRILRPDPDRPSGGDDKVIDRLASETIYNRRWIVDLLMFVSLVILIILLVGTRSTYSQVVQVGKQNTQLLEQVKSCTDPAGVCAKRGEKSTTAAVSQINLISIYAAYCANKQPPPVSAAAVQECVKAELSK